MSQRGNQPTVTVVFVLAVAFLFAVSALLVILLGSRVYGNVEAVSAARYNERVCLSYVVTKIRAGDRAGDDVRVGEIGGAPALYLEERLDGAVYETVIYAYDGLVRELFREKGLEMSPGAGVPIVEAKSLTFSFLRPDLLLIGYVGEDGDSHTAFVYLRSFGEEGL